MPDRDIFDLEQFLDQTGLDRDSIRDVIATFLDDIPTQIDRLRIAIKEGNGNQTRRMAHTIKGAAANLSSGSLYQAALQIEQIAEKCAPDILKARLADLETQFEKLRSLLLAEILSP